MQRAWKSFVWFPKLTSRRTSSLESGKQCVEREFPGAIYMASDGAGHWEKDGKVVAEIIMHTEGESWALRIAPSMAKAVLK